MKSNTNPTSPKITVIIPVYNAGRYLQECLKSVCQQSLQDIEIFCVNDGSDDDSLKILRSFQSQDERIHVVNQAHLGVFGARNRAIKEGHGEYVCFMDADDLYPNNTTLALLYNKAISYQALICGGSMRQFDDNGSWENFEGIFSKYTFDEEKMISFFDYQFDFGYQRFLFQRKFLIKNNIFFPSYTRFQDPPFFLKAMILAKRFLAIPQVTYCYRCGHQTDPMQWPLAKIGDMVKGWIDVLNLSKKYQLATMHAVAVEHVEDPYTFDAVLQKMYESESQILPLLVEANAAVDTRLLKQVRPELAERRQYVIKEFRVAIENHTALSNKYSMLNNEYCRLQYDFEQMSHSISFNVGRMLTWGPRKVRDMIKRVKA